MASVSGKVDPVVRRITAADIAEASAQGLRDFQALPLYGLAFGALYVLGGIIIVLCLTGLRHGLSGLSPRGRLCADRPLRRDRPLRNKPPPRGRPAGVASVRMWSTVHSRGEIGWMAFVTLFFFIIWMYQVRLLIALLLGLQRLVLEHPGIHQRWC